MLYIIMAPLYFFLGAFFSICFFDKRSREIISKLKEDNKIISIECGTLRGITKMHENNADAYRNEAIGLRLRLRELEGKQ